MKTPNLPRPFRVFLPIAVTAVVDGGILLSYLSQNPHWLNRAGALVAAIAAAAILLQIFAEIALEEERYDLEAQQGSVQEKGGTGPLYDLEVRLLIKRLEVQKKDIAKRRLRIASCVIATAMLGEMLHGFGDLLMSFLFGMRDLH